MPPEMAWVLIATRLSPNLPELIAAIDKDTLASVTALLASFTVVTEPSARAAVAMFVSFEPFNAGRKPSVSISTSWLAPLKTFPCAVTADLLVIVAQSAPPAQAAVALFKEYKE